MLAFYVEWHMREAWRELMFADTDQAAKATRDSVATAKRSASGQRKAASKLLDDEQPSIVRKVWAVDCCWRLDVLAFAPRRSSEVSPS